MRILLVDDDELLTQTLMTCLAEQHYAVDIAADGEAGWDYAQAATYDLIMLDINLPKCSGIELCQRLRQHKYSGPILLLTARGESSDKVIGLDAGADDYVVKPCTIEELSARIRALLRRQQGAATPLLEWGNLCLNPSTYEVTYNHQVLALSPKEYGLLELLLRNPQRVFSSGLILEHLWRFDDAPGEETVRSHIKRLRRKLKAAGADDIIETVYGLGYRLKVPPKPAQSPSETARMAAIAAWDHFRTPTLERLAILDQAVVALRAGTLSTEAHRAAESAAHKLAGSLGMFGFPEGSRLAKDIELWFQQSDARDSQPLHALVTDLHRVLDHPPQPSVWEDDSPSHQVPYSTQAAPRLLIVDQDSALVATLQAEAIAQGLQVERATTLDEVRTSLAQVRPSVVLLDLEVAQTRDSGLTLLKAVTTQCPEVPVLVFTQHDSFCDRLAVIRQGAYRFLSKKTALNQVLDVIQDLVKQHRPSEGSAIKVLAVDDDPLVLEALNQLLPRWGVHLVTLNNPADLWDALTAINPDLLIVDVDMPEISGIELCRVIRSDPLWDGLPILVLSACCDAETLLQLYSVGVDDYVAKPFTEPELTTRIFNRLERNRLLRSLAEIDPLTGLANRHGSTQAIRRYLSLSQRSHTPLCFAVLDLDAFNLVNDQYGHSGGDIVLKQVADLLRQQFRGEDVIARWGGDEFVIAMYGLSKRQAAERLEAVLHRVHQVDFSPDAETPLQLSLSAGVAEFPADGVDFYSVYRAAEAALKQVKSAGRDRILPA